MNYPTYDHIPSSSTTATKNLSYAFTENAGYIPPSSMIPPSYQAREDIPTMIYHQQGNSAAVNPALVSPSMSSLLFSNFNETLFDGSDLVSNLWQRLEIIYQRELICHAIQLQLSKSYKHLRPRDIEKNSPEETVVDLISEEGQDEAVPLAERPTACLQPHEEPIRTTQAEPLVRTISLSGDASPEIKSASVPSISSTPSVMSQPASYSDSQSAGGPSENAPVFQNTPQKSIPDVEAFQKELRLSGARGLEQLEEAISGELKQLKKLHNEVEEKLMNLIVQSLGLSDFAALDCEPKPILSFETIKTRYDSPDSPHSHALTLLFSVSLSLFPLSHMCTIIPEGIEKKCEADQSFKDDKEAK